MKKLGKEKLWQNGEIIYFIFFFAAAGIVMAAAIFMFNMELQGVETELSDLIVNQSGNQYMGGYEAGAKEAQLIITKSMTEQLSRGQYVSFSVPLSNGNVEELRLVPDIWCNSIAKN